jgi:hypothetical protein
MCGLMLFATSAKTWSTPGSICTHLCLLLLLLLHVRVAVAVEGLLER